MQTLLFLQKLGVEPQVIKDLVTEAGLPWVPVWEDWQRVEAPEEVCGIVTVQAAVSEEILDCFPNVRVITVAFTGYDVLDLEACRRRNIAVYNVPGYSTDSVAELTLALAINLLREIPRLDHGIREGGWKPADHGTELAGRTVGILGTGAIGLRVAELFTACRCRLIGWSRTPRTEFTDLGGTYVGLDEVFTQADVVSVHVQLNEETRGLVGERQLGLMKPGACLINTARGAVVDQAALTRALEQGRIRAALDVLDEEPPAADDPLRRVEHTVLTPHIAFQTHEALYRRARITVENIRAFLDGSGRNRV